MKIICIKGGLGNQMSQYAFYLSQAVNQNVFYSTYFTRRRTREHNGYELHEVFNIPEQSNFILDLLVRFARKLTVFYGKPVYHKFTSFLMKVMNIVGLKVIWGQQDYYFNKNYLLPCKGIYIHISGWYNNNYFNTKEDLIRNAFQFDCSRLNILSSEYLNKIRNENSISIHIRRGDYLSADWVNVLGNICTLNYYHEAIYLISNKISNPSFYIFSDDIPWAKENLFLSNSTYIEHNKGEDSWQDMYLMSQCKHHIIANSTFSWWGAWLNSNKNKIVVAPCKYDTTTEATDIYPKEWIIIGNK
jgi:hypothetical protein